MSSPSSTWTGAIELGLLNIPVTLGKAWSDERVAGLTKVCYHGDAVGAIKITRNERCEQCGGAPKHKRVAVEVEGGYRILDEDEVATIEASTKTLTLQIQDAQPLSSLPMIFSTGCYYIRHDEKAKATPRALNRLVMALGKTGYGLICEWGNSSSQKLFVISVERGILIGRIIPHLTEIRVPSTLERLHFSVPENKAETEKMVELLKAVRNPEGFQYQDYSDKGYALRQAAVERILDGITEELYDDESEAETEQIDVMAALENAIAAMTTKE